MPKIEHEIEIACPIEQVYEVSQDYAVRYEWDPFPEKIEFLEGAKEIKVGVRVNVLAKSGLSMVVEFIQVSPPTVAAIKMVKGPSILKSFVGSWRFIELENGHTRVIFTYSLSAKKCAFPFIANPVLSWYFGRKVKSRLIGLCRYCERSANAPHDVRTR